MSELPFAFLGPFGDAVEFIFSGTESPLGRGEVGGLADVGDLALRHIELSAAALAASLLLAVPLGVWLGHRGRGELFAVAAGNAGRAIPEFVLIAIMVAFVGTGFLNVTIALTILAIPPILTNTFVGIRQVDRTAVEAARGMGMSRPQIVRSVELPLAVPLLFAGLRVAAVTVVATAPIAAIAGGGGLGDVIVNQASYRLEGVLGASLCVMALSALVYGLFLVLERAATPRALRR